MGLGEKGKKKDKLKAKYKLTQNSTENSNTYVIFENTTILETFNLYIYNITFIPLLTSCMQTKLVKV